MSPLRDLEERRPPLSPQLAIRIALLGGIALALFAIIFFRLWFLQVLSGEQYIVQARENRTRDIRIQAPRGEIVDRNGSVLVDNRPANVVQVEPQGLPEQVVGDAARWGQLVGRRLKRPKGRRGDAVPLPPVATAELAARYRRLGRVLGMRPESIHRRVIEQLAQLPYSAVTVSSDAPNAVLAYIKERQDLFPGIDVERVFLRDYPHDELAAQLLGYVGEISPAELKQRRNRGVKQGTIIGKAGLEYTYDRYLRGRDGAKILRVDANGKFVGEALNRREPVPGRQLRLSVDLGLQRTGQEALGAIGGGLPGAFVAMNPRNGQVYAMGSYPSFDPSVFAKPIPRTKYAQLTSEENGAPLINRALNGVYALGSTFKPITALAALDKGVITPDTTIFDGGTFRIGNRVARNAGGAAYGPVALRRALQVSSDVFFYTLGRDLYYAGGEALQKWSKRMGLGRRTGIDLPGESPGQIPGRSWRADINEQERRCRKKTGDDYCGYALEIRPYNVGDNVNLAIGQGEIAASPLQIATAYAAIFTRGRVPRPHLGMEIQDANGRLVQEIDPGSARKVRIDRAWRQALQDGLGAAARAEGGTSAAVFAGWPSDRLPIFGKTGTAQVPFQGAIVDQSWYVGFVPHPTKPIVVAATIERGGFGADRAAPLVRRVLAKWFDLPDGMARPAAEDVRQAAD